MENSHNLDAEFAAITASSLVSAARALLGRNLAEGDGLDWVEADRIEHLLMVADERIQECFAALVPASQGDRGQLPQDCGCAGGRLFTDAEAEAIVARAAGRAV